MRRVILSVSFADTFRATLTSGLLVLVSLVVLQTQLINSASAEITFLRPWKHYYDSKLEIYVFPFPSSPFLYFTQNFVVSLNAITVSDAGQIYIASDGYNIHRFGQDGSYETS